MLAFQLLFAAMGFCILSNADPPDLSGNSKKDSYRGILEISPTLTIQRIAQCNATIRRLLVGKDGNTLFMSTDDAEVIAVPLRPEGRQFRIRADYGPVLGIDYFAESDTFAFTSPTRPRIGSTGPLSGWLYLRSSKNAPHLIKMPVSEYPNSCRFLNGNQIVLSLIGGQLLVIDILKNKTSTLVNTMGEVAIVCDVLENDKSSVVVQTDTEIQLRKVPGFQITGRWKSFAKDRILSTGTNGRAAVVGMQSGKIAFIEYDSIPKATIVGIATKPVGWVSLSKGNDWLVSCSDGGILQVWSVRNQHMLSQIRCNENSILGPTTVVGRDDVVIFAFDMQVFEIQGFRDK